MKPIKDLDELFIEVERQLKLRSNIECIGPPFVVLNGVELRELMMIIEERLCECPHPGCTCVCGHRKLCPEDGPSLTSDVYD